MNWDIPHIARIAGGKVVPVAARGTVTGVSTDSRTVQAGDLFIPLRGPRFNGHDFLAQAAQRGASACLSEEVIAGFPVPVIRVDDTLAALGALATAARRDFSGPVVAVTGSSGKTTTKEMLAVILSLTGAGLKTEGNFNNLIGLPLTLLRLVAEHRWAVLEMGMSARGEIARLAEIASPQVGIVTNIGEAHLETLHGLDGVARAKGELFAALPGDGTAIINVDDPRVAGLPVANGARRLLFGYDAAAEVRAEEVRIENDRLFFRLVLPQGSWPVSLFLAGRHNVHNALAAAAAASALGIEGDLIAQGLEAFRPLRGRMERVELPEGVLLLEDSYNANPLSVTAALTTLDESAPAGRRVAVLGDMLELGDTSAGLHRQIGLTASRRADYLVLLGEMAEEVASGAFHGGMAAQRVRIVASHEEATSVLHQLLQPGDRVLVKGSRGMRMEKVADALRSAGPCRAAGNS